VLIFAGKPGTGKSHLAGAILQAVLTPNVRYVTCMDLIRMVRETWRKDSERSETQVLRYLEGLDLLVVDEVGMQYGTEGEQTILFDVLDRRYREVRPMVLLTNQNRDGFKSFVGDRIYDRLVETSRWVPFDWDSYRGTARKQQ
jgi:DNA replication protein DnaC